MKILMAKYNNGEACFVVEGYPDMTFCIDMKGKTSKQQVIDKLKSIIPEPESDKEKIFNDLKLGTMKGTDI